MPFYHFTSVEHFTEISRRGLILPTESNVGSPIPVWEPSGAHYAPDVVWLLDTQELNYDHGLGRSAHDKTAVSIEVDVPAILWDNWPPVLEMHPTWRRNFVAAAGGEEATQHWYVWPAPIRAKRWESVTFTSLATVQEDMIKALQSNLKGSEFRGLIHAE